MGVHIEAQHNEEVIQIRSRELQLENTEKLEQIIPVVETIDEVDLPTIESNTHEIKDMLINNIDNQANLDDILDAINLSVKGITELKKANTRLSNTVKEMGKQIEELSKKFGDIDG